MIVTTGIVVDKMTAAGNVYPRATVEEMIRNFNPHSAAAIGGILDRKAIESLGQATHRVRKIFLHEDELMADVEVLEEISDETNLREDLQNGNYVAKPITINKLNQQAGIVGLRRIDIERRR
jgi:hypothetical protein